MEYQRYIDTLGADVLRVLLKHSAWVVSRIVLERAALAGRSSLDQWDHDLAVINAPRGVRDIERFLSAEDGTPDEDNEGGETGASRTDDQPGVTLKAAADLFGCSVRTIRRMIARGDLPAYRLVASSMIRVKRSDLVKIHAASPQPARAASADALIAKRRTRGGGHGDLARTLAQRRLGRHLRPLSWGS